MNKQEFEEKAKQDMEKMRQKLELQEQVKIVKTQDVVKGFRGLLVKPLMYLDRATFNIEKIMTSKITKCFTKEDWREIEELFQQAIIELTDYRNRLENSSNGVLK